MYGQQPVTSLAGEWHYRLDPKNEGVKNSWFNLRLDGNIHLPGTLDDTGIGNTVVTDTTQLAKEVMLHLSRKVTYTGAVWYQKEIKTDKDMEAAELLLERVLWKTDCWIDGKPVGSQESLIAPQTFNLGKLATGKHMFTLRIDNSKLRDISFNDFAHAYTDGTQIIWNGVIGKIELKDRSHTSIGTVKITASTANKQAVATINLLPEKKAKVYLHSIISLNGKTIAESPKNLLKGDTLQQVKITLPEVKNWDEFNPNVYTWTLFLTDKNGNVVYKREETFGFRELVSDKNILKINGRPLFLRGTLECNIFPIEGHPPMDEAGWIKVFTAAKAYGLNHLRFHSWCPPEAAFRVADSLGFYLHVELPLWSLTVGKDKETTKYLQDEAQRMVNYYGNHPSFCFWSMGNELEGDFDWLQNLVKTLKTQDSRHLYTTTTFSFQQGHGKAPEPRDDFFITQYTDNGWVRGQGIFNTNPPDFKTDYSAAIEGLSVPLVIHEVGQYSVYPDLSEISKYTGVLVPSNFKAVRNDLRKKGMLDLAAPYLKASGTLSANLYKEEIERALKTHGVGGFQLLDLHDFPGQGTALVGLLNAFWDSKGVITPEEFRKFCGPVVPLLRFEKAEYKNTEIFEAVAEVANYFNKALDDEPVWSVTTKDGKTVFKGSFGIKHIPIGNAENLGTISIPLASLKQAQELTVTLSLVKAGYSNHWKIWVYPQEAPLTTEGTIFTTSYKEAIAQLIKGNKVIFNPEVSNIKGIDGRFAPVFWSPVHFPDQPGSMGLLIDNTHPALADFPTNTYSDWQWWDLVTQSRSIVLDNIQFKGTPIVRVIDNFFKNRNLGVLMEYKLGKGKLLLCTMDIHTNLDKRPAAAQLKNSLLHYAGTSKFNPVNEINESDLSKLLLKP